jgi:signal peptidase I
MDPSFATGDYLIIDEISYRFSTPHRGDVVVFDASFIQGYKGQRFIKRVIGLPGENVKVANGQVEITKDGKTIVLNEEYLPEDLKTYQDRNITLGQGQYFVMGDNREFSYDSRAWGALDKKDIIGRAVLRLLPLTEIAWLK